MYTRVENTDKAKADNKYELWKKLKPLDKDHPLADDFIKYW